MAVKRFAAGGGFGRHRFLDDRRGCEPNAQVVRKRSFVETQMLHGGPAEFTILAMLLAHQWPDHIDLAATTLYVALVVTAPVVGYALLVLDIRRYLRSLRRALIVVVNYFPELPHWAHEPTPRCIAWFGLAMPCREEALLQAYRAKVKQVHPDRGGDRRKFDKLQQNFEAALKYLRRE